MMDTTQDVKGNRQSDVLVARAMPRSMNGFVFTLLVETKLLLQVLPHRIFVRILIKSDI